MRLGVSLLMDISSFKQRAYPYRFVMNQKEADLSWLLYRFKSSFTNQVYLVRVERYPYHFYGIKFYLKAHAHSDQKYNLLTNFNEPRPILNTCICIMLDIFQKDSKASFGFIGAETLSEKEKRIATGIESLTKRMSFYRRLLNTYFPQSNEYFEHYIDNQKSSYLIINRHQLETDSDLINKINSYFTEHYNDFD